MLDLLPWKQQGFLRVPYSHLSVGGSVTVPAPAGYTISLTLNLKYIDKEKAINRKIVTSSHLENCFISLHPVDYK